MALGTPSSADFSGSSEIFWQKKHRFHHQGTKPESAGLRRPSALEQRRLASRRAARLPAAELAWRSVRKDAGPAWGHSPGWASGDSRNAPARAMGHAISPHRWEFLEAATGRQARTEFQRELDDTRQLGQVVEMPVTGIKKQVVLHDERRYPNIIGRNGRSLTAELGE